MLRKGVTLDRMLSGSKTRQNIAPRWMAMWLARARGYTTSQIGREFGGRDNTTVMHATRMIDRRIRRDSAFATEMRTLDGLSALPSREPPP